MHGYFSLFTAITKKFIVSKILEIIIEKIMKKRLKNIFFFNFSIP